jgi:hypothetical protein
VFLNSHYSAPIISMCGGAAQRRVACFLPRFARCRGPALEDRRSRAASSSDVDVVASFDNMTGRDANPTLCPRCDAKMEWRRLKPAVSALQTQARVLPGRGTATESVPNTPATPPDLNPARRPFHHTLSASGASPSRGVSPIFRLARLQQRRTTRPSPAPPHRERAGGSRRRGRPGPCAPGRRDPRSDRAARARRASRRRRLRH